MICSNTLVAHTHNLSHCPRTKLKTQSKNMSLPVLSSSFHKVWTLGGEKRVEVLSSRVMWFALGSTSKTWTTFPERSHCITAAAWARAWDVFDDSNGFYFLQEITSPKIDHSHRITQTSLLIKYRKIDLFKCISI